MKLLGFLFRLVLVVGLIIWLADRPGTAHIEWRDFAFDMSAAVLLVIVAGIAYAFVLLNRLWRFIIDGPRVWKLNRHIGKLKDGQTELTKGFAALAAGRPSDAGRSAVKARKLWGETPTTRLLQAQAAQLAGDAGAAKSIYQSMTADPLAAPIGYRGLIMAALRAGNLDEAQRQCQLLEATKADVPWLSLARFEIALRSENWREANAALAKARKAKTLPAPLADKNEAALLLADARIALQDSLPKKAIELAEKAKRLRSDWAPATLALAEALIVAKHERAASRLIEKAWSKAPHPQFIPLYYWAMHPEKPMESFKMIDRLTRGTREAAPSLMALADAALKADLWGEARRFLMLLVNTRQATQQTYQLLARLELRETHDEKASAAWLAKVAAAPLDPTWLCASCGAAHETWAATCESCHAFNTLEWRALGKGRTVSDKDFLPALPTGYLT